MDKKYDKESGKTSKTNIKDINIVSIKFVKILGNISGLTSNKTDAS